MTILIDADGCPVVDLTLQTAAKYNVPVLILCDTAHQIQRDGAQTLTFDKGADSVDFALVNRVHPGDFVITQDYGLASMCLARRARVLNQNGLEYTSENIDSLLFRRHENKKLLRAGKHPKGTPKRTKEQDRVYKSTLENILQSLKRPQYLRIIIQVITQAWRLYIATLNSKESRSDIFVQKTSDRCISLYFWLFD